MINKVTEREVRVSGEVHSKMSSTLPLAMTGLIQFLWPTEALEQINRSSS